MDTPTVILRRSTTEGIDAAATSSQGGAGGTAPDEPAIEIPQQLGPLRLVREIGRGAMGVVWLAHHQMLDREVAVKFLLGVNRPADDPGFARFLEGARAAAAVRHPALTAVHHLDLVQNVPYLVMEFVHGPTLSALIRRNGPMSPAAAVRVLKQCAEGVAELHDRNIVHRDIKSSNILLDGAGEAFVTDFGLACGRIPQGAAVNMGGLAGTPAYMAPEMFDGAVSLRSDVYALGVTLFEVLAGEVPFLGSVSEVQRKHASAEVPLESLHSKGVPQPLVEVVERAMNKNPLFRLKTARHFALALDDAAKAARLRPADSAHLAGLVRKCMDGSSTSGGTGADDSAGSTEKGSSYHSKLSLMASEKRQQTPPPRGYDSRDPWKPAVPRSAPPPPKRPSED